MKQYNRVVLLSGGVDSAYILHKVTRKFVEGGPRARSSSLGVGDKTVALFVDYGQPSASAEWLSAQAIAEAVCVPISRVDVAGVGLGDMGNREGARVVPARNLWLIALAAAFLPVSAPPIPQVGFSRDQVWIGAAPQDHDDYLDCREIFLEEMRRSMLLLGNDLRWSDAAREERVLCLETSTLLELTHSCYEEVACGECPSCLQ